MPIDKEAIAALDATDEEKKGVLAIQSLLSTTGDSEPIETSLFNWRNVLSVRDRETTLAFFSIIFPEEAANGLDT